MTSTAPSRRLLLAAAAATTALLAVVPSAHAATVSVGRGKLTYTAAPGESNGVTVTAAGSGAYRVTDVGSTDAGAAVSLKRGVGCSAAADSVICTGARSVAANLGDGDDSFDATGVALPTNVRGGAGDDLLRTGAGFDTVNGEDGDDRVDGGLGADTLAGGAGVDTVDYSSHAASEAVKVNLDGVRNDGLRWTPLDQVGADFENIVGGAGDDELTGSAGANAIDAGAGDDVVDAGAGDDSLDGGPGADQLSGGAGDDQLAARDGALDTLACGDGADAGTADASDVVAADCEAVARPTQQQPGGEDPTVEPPPAGGDPTFGLPRSRLEAMVLPKQSPKVSASGVVSLTVGCPPASGGCDGKVSLELEQPSAARARVLAGAGVVAAAGKRTVIGLGSKRFHAKAGQRRGVTVRMSRRGRKRILRKRKRKPTRIRAYLRVTARTPDGRKIEVRRPVKLKLARRTPRRGHSHRRPVSSGPLR